MEAHTLGEKGAHTTFCLPVQGDDGQEGLSWPGIFSW